MQLRFSTSQFPTPGQVLCRGHQLVTVPASSTYRWLPGPRTDSCGKPLQCGLGGEWC